MAGIDDGDETDSREFHSPCEHEDIRNNWFVRIESYNPVRGYKPCELS